jgi:hypothetical protein
MGGDESDEEEDFEEDDAEYVEEKPAPAKTSLKPKR